MSDNANNEDAPLLAEAPADAAPQPLEEAVHEDGGGDAAAGEAATAPAQLEGEEDSPSGYQQGAESTEGDDSTQVGPLRNAGSGPYSRAESVATREGLEENVSITERPMQMSTTLPPPKTSLPPSPTNATMTPIKERGSEPKKGAPPSLMTRRKSSSALNIDPPKLAPQSRLPVAQRPRSTTQRRAIPTGTLTPLYNANNMTTKEESMAFRLRNGVSPNYMGPVHVVENINVACAQCGAPVDPIARVPAGKLFFHPQCIRCKLCGRNDIVDAYFQVMSDSAICSECAVKGLARCVPREAAAARGIVVGALSGSIDNAIKQHDRRHKLQPINQSTVEGAIPPSLALSPIHNRTNSTSRSMELIQRQQYYTQNDNNVMGMPPPVSPSSRGSSRPGTSSQRRRKKGKQIS
ncbi:hypothetical protein DQ04_09351020 [Trypanosoma grayi]|uniref:hypothetical protein n=1 Tax=Trypanosoma grayi TaxID=71804 RepID=UPI0004F48E16|nr:hypothetical protein DQ04_09351020 [Trypanosoma grayi]KEG07586.1 hypothetical protein DQ04_09351020 [Trypanosoma grayi]